MGSSDLRRRKLTRLSSPSTSTTSRVTARLMPSMPVNSSAPVTSTPPRRPSMRSVVDRPREPSSWERLTSSPCTRPARTPRTRRDSWSSNLSWRGCALLRSKYLPVLSDLYYTILYCVLHYSTVQYNTVQSSNGTLHSCPEQSLGSLCHLNCNCPSIFVAVKLCLTFVLVSVFIVYRV